MQKELTQEEIKFVEKFHNIIDRNMRRINKWWEEESQGGDNASAELNSQVLEYAKEISIGGAEVIGYYGMTIFHQLVWHNYYEAAEILLKKGINPDIRGGTGKGDYTESYIGVTPLHLACHNGNLEMVKLLLKYGADTTLVDNSGRNCFHFLASSYVSHIWCGVASNDKVASKQRMEIAPLLKCNINEKDKLGNIPLLSLFNEYSLFPMFFLDIFIDIGADVTDVDNEGNTALMLATYNNKVTSALKLMKNKGLINMQNNSGDTALHIALREYKYAIAYMLIENNADMNIQNNKGETASELMNERGNKLILKQVNNPRRFGIEDLFDVIDSFANDWWGGAYDEYNTFIYYICRKILRKIDVDDDTELIYVKKLLELMIRRSEGCALIDILMEEDYDLCMSICEGSTVTTIRDICIEECYKDISIMQKLDELGVDFDNALVCGCTPANIIASKFMRWDTDIYVHNMLAKALEYMSVKSMEVLNNEGFCAVHLAVKNNSYVLLQKMIERGVNIGITTDGPAEAGNTPLHLACIHQNTSIVKILMESGADDSVKNMEGETPAHCLFLRKTWPWEFDPEKCIEILKELNTIDEPTTKTGKTPIFMAQDMSVTWNEDITELLIDKGADVRRADNKGNTPLTACASHRPDRDIVKLMLKEGADINARDERGNNVLYYVINKGDCELARYLIKKGADYNIVNNKGETPVGIAIKNGYESVLELMTDIKVVVSDEENGYNDNDFEDNDFDDDDVDDDYEYDENAYYTDEQRATMEKEKEYLVLLKTYSEIFGDETGNQLAHIVVRMSEINQSGQIQENMEEYMELTNKFQSIMSSQNGMHKIAEYNAKAVSMLSEEE